MKSHEAMAVLEKVHARAPTSYNPEYSCTHVDSQITYTIVFKSQTA